MNRLLKFLVIVLLMPVSCTTFVKFNVEHGPLINFDDSITVIPFEWKFYSDSTRAHLARYITEELLRGIRRIGAYNLVHPDNLIGVDRADYWEFVDVYIIGEIKDVDINDKEEKRDEGIYINRTVTVTIEYSYIRAINNEVLGVFNKQSRQSESFKKEKEFGAIFLGIIMNIIDDLIFGRDTKITDLVISSVRQFSSMMREELVLYSSMEKRYIEESKNNDPRFKRAKRLVRKGKISEAIELYNEIYEQTGSAVAGYNTAILLQKEGQFVEALNVLVNLDTRITRSGVVSPQFIINEIEQIKELIAGLERAENFRNR